MPDPKPPSPTPPGSRPTDAQKQLERAFRFKPLGQERDSFAVLLDQDRFGFSPHRPH